MSVTLRQLAEWVDGEVEGDGDLPITDARPVGEACPGDITFAADDRHLDQFHHSHAAAAFVPATAKANGKPVIRVHDPLTAFANAFQRFRPRAIEDAPGIHPSSVIHPTAVIGPGARIAAFAVVGAGTVIGSGCRLHAGVVIGARCRLGDDVTLHPHAVLYDGSVIGHGVVIHAHAVIGADGFGYRGADGQHVKVPQLGHVEIGDDVEIGAGSAIDRGTFGATRIGDGTKIDNLVHIAHNCTIGKRNIVLAQAGIAGSCRTGDQVIIAGQAGLRDHLTIGARSVVGPQAGVSKDVPEDDWVMGTPAANIRDWKLACAGYFKLPEIRKTLRRVVKHLGLAEEET